MVNDLQKSCSIKFDMIEMLIYSDLRKISEISKIKYDLYAIKINYKTKEQNYEII